MKLILRMFIRFTYSFKITNSFALFGVLMLSLYKALGRTFSTAVLLTRGKFGIRLPLFVYFFVAHPFLLLDSSRAFGHWRKVSHWFV